MYINSNKFRKMKKLIVMFFALVISSAMIFAQEQVPVKKQTKQQTQEQVKTQAHDQSGDPIMTQERVRANEGKGTMKRSENGKMRKQNHGAEVSGVAKQKRDQKRDATGDGTMQRDRDQVNKQVKPRTGARPPMQGTTPPRMGTMQRGGRK